jgi:hypothetical protein
VDPGPSARRSVIIILRVPRWSMAAFERWKVNPNREQRICAISTEPVAMLRLQGERWRMRRRR